MTTCPNHNSDPFSGKQRFTPLHGLCVGALAGALWSLADIPLVCLRGQRIPFELPLLLLAVYIAAGALLGGAIVAIATWRSANRSSASQAITNAGRGIFVFAVGLAMALFADRVTRGGWEEIETGLSLPAGGILIIAAMGALWVGTRDCASILPATTLAGRVFCVALFSAMWAPLNSVYDAPAVSPMSAGVNGGYLAVALLVYAFIRRIGRPFARHIKLSTTRQLLQATVFVCLISLATSWTVLAARAPQPLIQRADKLIPPPPAAPNVVLIVLDTTRADRLSAYGYSKDTTPNLSEFARSSVLYMQAVAPTSWTLPSHATIFTGLMPTEHGAHWYAKGTDGHGVPTALRLVPEADTLAEKLQARGYNTAAIIGNSAMLNRTHGVEQGFGYYDDRSRAAIDACRTNALSPAKWVCFAYRALFGRGDMCRYADEITDESLRWLDHRGDRPFFLFINYLDPHEPYIPRPEYREQLGHPASGVTEISMIYDEELAFLDDHLGRLFDGLRRRELFDDAMIVVTADHGEAFGEHGNWQHGQSLYQEEIHVPLLVRYPQGRLTGRRDEPTSLVVISPMILRAVGLETSAPLAQQTWQPFTSAIAELHHHGKLTSGDSSGVTRALYGNDLIKTILNSSDNAAPELYDLATDPGERHNLAGQSNESINDLARAEQVWSTAAESRRITDGVQTALDADVLEQLRALGYVD